MEITPAERPVESLKCAEPQREKLRLMLLRKQLEVEQENDRTLTEMVSHLGRNLDIRV